MGFRMSKSIRVAPGVRLNVSKSGIGASVGAGGVRYSAHSSGRRTVSARTGVPGVSYQKTTTARGIGATSNHGYSPSNPSASLKPGIFAPKGEKQLFKAIQAQDFQAVEQVGVNYEHFRIAAWSLAGLKMLKSNPQAAARLLKNVFSTGRNPEDDPFIKKYVAAELTLSIAPGVTATLPVSRDAIGLTLAELEQEADNIDGAISLVEQLSPTTYAAVSLAELYATAERWDDVIEMTEWLQNEDDASALLLCYRGMALRHQGYNSAAHEALKEALRKRKQPAEIRQLALSERSLNYISQGKKSMARKDLEKILSENSNYHGIRERLAELEG